MRLRAGRLAGAWPLALPALACLAVYSGVVGFGFLSYDDEGYVTRNPHVLAGLTGRGLAWAFSTLHMKNWHPLTWLSHMADVEMFGADPGMHHLVNAVLHAANATLLGLALFALTGARGRSAFVAALFAVHPLHVESVAWVAERKDLLCAFFFLLSVLAYRRYAGSPTRRRYAAVLLFQALALLAKPMAVTLPLALLLLDFWPLGRLRFDGGAGGAPAGLPGGRGPAGLLREKAPLFALSAASAAVTWIAQARGEAVVATAVIPVSARLANAAVSYLGYLRKAVWPSGLAVVYPHPWESGGIPAWQAAGAFLVLAAVTVLAVRAGRRFPFATAGWLWYVVTLLPVIGMIQVGRQAMADRYTYLPLIGVFVAVAWGAAGRVGRARGGRRAVLAAGAAAVLLLAAAARVQAAHWRDDLSLYRHALSVTSRNWVIEYNLADALFLRGRTDEAIPHFREAVRLRPDMAAMRFNFGFALESAGRRAEAAEQYRESLRLRPGDAAAAEALARLGGAERAAPAAPRPD